MKANTFIGNHPTQSFSCYVAHFSKYDSEIIDGKQYIIGTELKEDKKVFSFEKKERTELLSSLLLLYESLPDGLYERTIGSSPENFPTDEVDKIIDWCIKYGMPMEDDEKYDNPQTIEIKGTEFNISGGRKLWQKYGKIGFNIKKFYNRLHHLYSVYELWQKAYLGEGDYDNFYVKANTSNKACMELIEMHMSTLEICLKPSFKEILPTLVLECPDLMETAKAQMFFECVSIGENSIGVCEVCGSPFAKYRKNHTQCPKCQQTAYQRSRNKKKIRETINKI